jgi:hypothetical protein
MGSKLYSRQTKNFGDMRSNYGLSVLNNFSEHNFQQLIEIVYRHSTFSLYVLNIGLIHDLRKLMKFVYWSLTFIIYVQNLGSNYDSHQPKKFLYWCHSYRRSNTQAQNTRFVPRHVWNPLWAQIRLMTSAKTVLTTQLRFMSFVIQYFIRMAQVLFHDNFQ